MTRLRTIDPDEATGLLARIYREALTRAGKVFNVLRCQSVRPEVLERSTELYREVVHSDRSPLSRAQRGMTATTVSRANRCLY